MNEDDHFGAYLDLCEAIADRLYREGIWPWRDSTSFDDLVESKGNSNDL